MAYLDSFGHKEGYSSQVEIPGIASVIDENVISQVTYGNHIELSSTIIMAVYNDTSVSKGYVKFGTRVSDFCIEWGTAVEFVATACAYIIPVRISDTKFGIVYQLVSDTKGYIMCGTVAGTVPTLGTVAKFKDAAACKPIGANLWDTDKILIAYANTTTNGQCIVAVTTNINSVTFGAEATFVATTDITAYSRLTQLCRHSATLASVVYRVSATVTEVVTLSLSTTTITVNTAGKAAFGGSADIRYPSIGALSATSFVLAYTDATDTNKGNAQIGTISGTTITAGASEYNFDATNYAARIPTVTVISSTLFAIGYSPNTAVSVYVIIGSVAATVIAFGTYQNVAAAGAGYSYRVNDTVVNITYTKSGQLTFSYLNFYLKQFICGMVEYNYNVVSISSMCYRVATAGAGEQIELSSVYLKSNLLGFVQTTDLLTDYSGGLYFNGTRPSNRFYSTADGNPVAAGQSIAECKRVGMSNEPIVLTAGQSLYAALDINQSSSPVRGGCTVFGLKRSV